MYVDSNGDGARFRGRRRRNVARGGSLRLLAQPGMQRILFWQKAPLKALTVQSLPAKGVDAFLCNVFHQRKELAERDSSS